MGLNNSVTEGILNGDGLARVNQGFNQVATPTSDLIPRV
jgi:hypothetical protein